MPRNAIAGHFVVALFDLAISEEPLQERLITVYKEQILKPDIPDALAALPPALRDEVQYVLDVLSRIEAAYAAGQLRYQDARLIIYRIWGVVNKMQQAANEPDWKKS